MIRQPKTKGGSNNRYPMFYQESKLSGRARRRTGSRIWLILLFSLLLLITGLFLAGPYLPDFGRSKSIVQKTPSSIPVYSGTDTLILKDNIPEFTSVDLEKCVGETYSRLDVLGRCGPAIAMLHKSMMPTEQRGSIGQVKPTGWVQKKYPGLVRSEPPYLYNRCHLIAFALTGQNANEQNLITGTRYMNASLMLPYEEQIMKYLEATDNHVLYRVSPLFVKTELLARGVELEAYSVEDEGEGICFHVFLYNVQPGVEITYASGESRQACSHGLSEHY